MTPTISNWRRALMVFGYMTTTTPATEPAKPSAPAGRPDTKEDGA